MTDATMTNRTTLQLDLIDEDPDQPRTTETEDSDEPSLQELADSIKSMGVLQPILVVQQDNGRYKLVAGHRRTRAAKLAGLSEIPAVIRDTDDPGNTLAAQIVENVQRQKLSPADLCNALLRLKKDFNLSIDEIAKRIGRHRSWVNKIILVAEDTGYVRLAVSEGIFVNMEAAYRFRGLSLEDQETLYKEAKKSGVQLTHTAVVDRKKQEFFIPPDQGGYEGAGVYDPKKYAEPKSTFVAVQEEKRQAGQQEPEHEERSFQASAVAIKPDPKDFETGMYDKPVVYRDFGTTWVIRVSESALRELVEKRGVHVKTEEDLINGVSSIFHE